MSMHDPPHPGEFIREIYMEPFGLSSRKVARSLNVAASTFIRLLHCESSVTPEMALRLAHVFGRTPESWLAMQDHYSLWHAKQKVDMRDVKKLELTSV
ncbi:MAG: transcriptional regulator [Candidatus Scalindua rubra]|uniref:Transcriptional regulator n=1 Tax=Candidatus Scalindua rubra TaxID=1872076 RepID=A0A1E3X3V8_9BACT|nr:MAG: transcriptional regulator [Candidatus Scalindua rubra]